MQGPALRDRAPTWQNALIKGGEAPDGTLKQWPASFNADKLALTPRRRYRRGIGMMKRQGAELVERLDFGCREGAIVDADVVETAGTIFVWQQAMNGGLARAA